LILLLLLVPFFTLVNAQYMGEVTPDIWYEKSKIVLQEYVDNVLIQNATIVNDSIKTRISVAPEDSLPPTHHVRIIYDVIEDDKIRHWDSIYKIDFGAFARTPENAKLVKIYENEYLAPNQIKNKKFEEVESYLTGMLQNIMCRQGFDKVTKESTDESMCVTPKSVGKLVDRGWIKMDYLALGILKSENYNSVYVPITVTHMQPYENNLNYSFISTTVWNLRNIPSDYSVNVIDPHGEEVKNCSTPSAESPQSPHSVNEWRLFLNTCGHQRILGNYTVIVSSDTLNEKLVVNVDK